MVLEILKKLFQYIQKVIFINLQNYIKLFINIIQIKNNRYHHPLLR